MNDYVVDPYLYAKFYHDTITPLCPPKYAKMRIKWLGKDVPFGGPKNKILHFDPIFPPKPQIFGQFSTGLKISRQKGLNNEDARL